MEASAAIAEPPTAMPEQITFARVTLGYGRHAVLSDLNFAICRGDYIGIVGPNGAGKTTLLKGILGTLKPRGGRISRKENLHFGYVPQFNTVDETYPLTVLDLALMGRYGHIGLIRRPSRTDRERSLAALEQVGIADLADRLFRDLSGGQRQRVLMARALATDPDILVLDEPTNDMDIAAERATMDLIDSLHADGHQTILIVSHLLNVVVGHVHKLAFLGAGSFKIMPVEEAATTAHLQRLYHVPVQVAELNGRRVVLW